MTILADTNVLLALLHPQHALHSEATLTADRLVEAQHVICCVSQNFCELWAVATSNGLGLAAPDALRMIRLLDQNFLRLPETDSTHVEWRRLIDTVPVAGKRAHDARLVAAMCANGVRHTLTYNASDFRGFPGIEGLTPSRAASDATLLY